MSYESRLCSDRLKLNIKKLRTLKIWNWAVDQTTIADKAEFVGAFVSAIKMQAGKQRKRQYKKENQKRKGRKTGKGRKLDAILVFQTPSPSLFENMAQHQSILIPRTSLKSIPIPIPILGSYQSSIPISIPIPEEWDLQYQYQYQYWPKNQYLNTNTNTCCQFYYIAFTKLFQFYQI